MGERAPGLIPLHEDGITAEIVAWLIRTADRRRAMRRYSVELHVSENQVRFSLTEHETAVIDKPVVKC